MPSLAIDIGGTKFSLALFEADRMTHRASRPTNRGGGPEWMLAEIEKIVRGDGMRAPWPRFDRCGVGFGGPVDFVHQRIALSTHAGGWRDFPLVERISEMFGAPVPNVIVDNDANAGALGEAIYGAGRGHLPLFYMTLSTGVGGGLVVSNVLSDVLGGAAVYRGADSWAGEIGHLTIRPGGPECLCGARGCLERMCGGLWLERDHGKPAPELFDDARFVDGYVADLALGLKAAVMLLNPARIVIGGGIAKAGEKLFEPLRAELRRQVTHWSHARLDVVPAELGDDSVLWGARCLVTAC